MARLDVATLLLLLSSLYVTMQMVDSAADAQLPSSILDWMVKMETEFNELKQNLTETQDTLKVTESALKVTQTTLMVTESALKVTQTALKVTQTDLNDTQTDLKNTQATLKVTQTVLQDTQVELDESKTQTARLERHVEDTQSAQMESEARITQLESDEVLDQNIISSHRNSRGTGHNCILGSRYGYEEYIDMYAYGDPVSLDIVHGGPYECLNLCYVTPDCEAVNIDSNTQQCMGLMNVFLNNTNEGWGYYKLIEPDECVVNDDPAVIFQATISADHYYPAAGEIVVWDTVRVDTTGDLGSDGKYRCPVSGVYSFTMEGISYSGSYDIFFDIMHENNIVKRIYNGYGSALTVSGTAYIDCVAGDYVWVQSYSTSCLESSYWQSTFSGFLLSMKV